MLFKNRRDAGAALAEELLSLRGKKEAVVLAIPRGGVPVAKEVADKLNLPIGLVVTKKIGAPKHEELAIGAVGENGTVVLDEKLIASLRISEELVAKQVESAKLKVTDYASKFRSTKRDLEERTAILVDDGVATGATMEAAIRHLKTSGIKKLVIAVPVAPKDTAGRLVGLVDEAVILSTPRDFRAVGQFYEEFPQLTDKEVLQLLQ